MEWMFLPLKRYADFSGRSRRLEYWLFMLGFYLLLFALGLVFGVSGAFAPGADRTPSPMVGIMVAVMGIAFLALFIPALAVQVRRFHDQDKSGWFVLLNFIPYIGGLVVLVFMCLPGTAGPNRYGDDPLDPHGATHLDEVFR